jgi:hypothetical protein
MGVLLGRLTPIQFLILAFIESSFAIVLEHILFSILHVSFGAKEQIDWGILKDITFIKISCLISQVQFFLKISNSSFLL